MLLVVGLDNIYVIISLFYALLTLCGEILSGIVRLYNQLVVINEVLLPRLVHNAFQCMLVSSAIDGYYVNCCLVGQQKNVC
jgi:hypothetical protein